MYTKTSIYLQEKAKCTRTLLLYVHLQMVFKEVHKKYSGTQLEKPLETALFLAVKHFVILMYTFIATVITYTQIWIHA